MQNISYTYGSVGNITNITNTTTGADGLDSSFVYNYSYDALCRLASRIGGGFAPHPDLNHYDSLTDQVELPHSGDYHHKALALVELWTRQAECAGLQPSLAFDYSLAEGNLHNPLPEPADGERYFYHSDHLGSSAFITTEMRSIREDLQKSNTTEQNGYATQFLAYLPFGETLNEEQNSSNYYSPFKFSAKEKDPETGYSYFGARYYSPELSIWLSVDPLSDKYPSLSPYNYCALNPIILKDPDGNLPWLIGAVVGAASEVAAQIAVNKVTGRKWNQFDYADIAASTIAGAISGGLSSLTKINKARKVAIAVTQASQVAVSSAVDLELSYGNQAVKLSLPGVNEESLNASGFIIDVKGKALDEIGVEAALGGLGAGAKKFISGAFNDDIAKKADDLVAQIKSGAGSKSDMTALGQLETTAIQHEITAESMTNWSGKYTLEEVKGLMNVD